VEADQSNQQTVKSGGNPLTRWLHPQQGRQTRGILSKAVKVKEQDQKKAKDERLNSDEQSQVDEESWQL